MRSFTRSGSFPTSCPATMAVPEVGSMSPQSMRMVVDLPAPLAPRNPKISPRATVKFTPSTALNGPKFLERSRTVMASSIMIF